MEFVEHNTETNSDHFKSLHKIGKCYIDTNANLSKKLTYDRSKHLSQISLHITLTKVSNIMSASKNKKLANCRGQ